MLASLLAAGMPLGAQNLGSEYRLKRVIPVEGRQGVAADSNFYYVSGSTALYKYDKQGRLAAKNERPFEGLPLAANHLGAASVVITRDDFESACTVGYTIDRDEILAAIKELEIRDERLETRH